MLNLKMPTALRAPNEIKLHVKRALANGVTVGEIKKNRCCAAGRMGLSERQVEWAADRCACQRVRPSQPLLLRERLIYC